MEVGASLPLPTKEKKMLTVKVMWYSPQWPTHSVYTTPSYSVYLLASGETQLILEAANGQTKELLLSADCKAYVMNESGATVDIIYGTSLPDKS
jgi:hypothetical protein